MTKSPAKTEKQRIRRMKNSVKRIDNMEISLWFGLTMVYVVFVAILSGISKAYLPDLLYLGKIPLDPQTGIWVFGVTMWIPMSLLLQAYFKRR